MKKKTTITFLLSGLLFISGIKAQTIQEGMIHLYSDRFKSAETVFQKLLATNPNNIEATYWLGQTYFDEDKNAMARQLYQKALETNGSAPLILVGLGHADLLDNKTADARQKFETALAASPNRAKKGDDPMVATAIGRANVDAKSGDFNYAIQLLEAATAKDPKNTETLLQLGNAYRKAKPGEGGGQAFATYKKALEADPKFAVANLRLAKLFESQKNWELYLQYENDAVKADPKFGPSYYDLFYYYFFRSKFPEAEEQLKNYVAVADDVVQNDYLYAQLCYGKKDFDCTITKAMNVVNAMGKDTKAKVYKLLAYAYFDKGDYANAQKFLGNYFGKEKPEGVISQDYKLQADILSKSGGSNDDIYSAYIKGAALDTVLSSRIDFLKQGAAYFKTNKMRDKEGDIIQKIIETKPKPTINDYFDLTLARYFTGNYGQSRIIADSMIQKFPDQVYGYEWKFNSSNAVDTVKKDSIALPDALALYAFAQKDTAKFRKQYLSSVKFLGAYYINQAKDKEKSLEFFNKWLEADPANASTITPIIEQIKKMPVRQSGTPPRGNAPPLNTTEKKTAIATDSKSKSTMVSKQPVIKK